jgi:Uma2 family endonuclease
MAFAADLRTLTNLTDQQFYALCRAQPDVKFERTPGGHLLIMAPTGGETGNRNIELSADFVIWNRQALLGVLFDSSTCFNLPGGGDRSPDLAWVRQARWDALTPEQRETFPPIAPDFVLELMSPSDALSEAQAKLAEYIQSGVQLGWLINRKLRRVWIYRPDAEPEVLDNPARLSGEAVLPGFTLNMAVVW